LNLTTQKKEDAGRDNEQSHDYIKSLKAKAEQCNQPVQDEPDGQQEHTDVFGESFHGSNPFFIWLIDWYHAKDADPSHDCFIFFLSGAI
jgi:hypothetical protein